MLQAIINPAIVVHPINQEQPFAVPVFMSLVHAVVAFGNPREGSVSADVWGSNLLTQSLSHFTRLLAEPGMDLTRQDMLSSVVSQALDALLEHDIIAHLDESREFVLHSDFFRFVEDARSAAPLHPVASKAAV